MALLTPDYTALQDAGNWTKLMVVQEELKTMPFGEIWNEYCSRCGVPGDGQWFEQVEKYEADGVLLKEGTALSNDYAVIDRLMLGAQSGSVEGEDGVTTAFEITASYDNVSVYCDAENVIHSDDFDDADSLFRDEEEKKSDESENDDADFDNYTDEDEASARVINLDKLQFGRNYNKD